MEILSLNKETIFILITCVLCTKNLILRGVVDQLYFPVHRSQLWMIEYSFIFDWIFNYIWLNIQLYFPVHRSQLWMIEYSRTNIKFRSLPLMDVINLSDRIFSAFQTSCTNILWGFFSLKFFVFFSSDSFLVKTTFGWIAIS